MGHDRRSREWGRRLPMPILAIVLCAASTHAALFDVAPDGSSIVAHVSAMQALVTNRGTGVLTDVPLADGTHASFSLTPVDVFTSTARIVEFDGTTAREVGRPSDVALYHGTDLSTAARTMTLAVGRNRVFGMVWEGDRPTTVLRPTTGDRVEVLDASTIAAGPNADCAGAVRPPVQHGATGDVARSAKQPAIAQLAPSPTLVAEVLVDVAYDMYHVAFLDNPTDATDYVAFLFARSRRSTAATSGPPCWSTSSSSGAHRIPSVARTSPHSSPHTDPGTSEIEAASRATPPSC